VGPLPCANDMCAVQKSAMAIQNEFFTKFFSIVSPSSLVRGGLRVAAIPKS
jgi:hypothetical protein